MVQIKVDRILTLTFMNDTLPFPPGFPLHDFPDLTEEVLFAFHFQINKLIYVNAAFERVWNIPRTDVISGMFPLIKTVHDDDKSLVIQALATIRENKRPQKLEFRIELPDKSVKWIKLNAYVSEKGNSEIIVGIATDITAEKNYSDTLHKFNDKKNSILQILSHVLLGPLGNIQISTSLLAKNSKLSGDEPVLKILHNITDNSKRSIKMIRDLINNEFLQTSESAFVKQRVDIVQKIATMVVQYQQSPGFMPQRFSFTTSLDSLYVSIDESKFLQAINNLLSNSLKFTGEDGHIEISITEPDEKNILIMIRDNGIGIPADMQPFIFDKFTRARRRGLHGEPTTGLGMSIIKTIVEWHNGRIWFESTEGQGTTFYIEIPKDS